MINFSRKIIFLFMLLFSINLNAQVAKDSLLAGLNRTHPRLIASETDFDRIAKEKETDAYVKEAFQKIYMNGEDIIKEPVSTFVIPDGLRLLATSRRVVERVSRLAFLYRVTKEEKFADRAWRELHAASQFPDWNPKHFLDVGEMTYAFALGYDWLFDYWNSDQKKIIKSAIIEKGLSRALLAYNKLSNNNEGWWPKVPHNWNQVCNGGIGVGALAIADEEPALAACILENVLQNLPLAMKHFAPDGAWNEGPGYWSYATMYNVAIIASLKRALGNDFGLSDIEGFSKTGLFPIYNSSPFNKSFNYADGGDGAIVAPQLFWFARTFNQPAVARYLYEFKPANPFALLWYDPQLLRVDGDLPTGAYYRESEVVTLRSKWRDSLATFVAFKAGDNKANHSHLDVGSFILDASGERWIFDLGAENYNVPAYFSSGAQGRRWTYYRTRAEGHNTLVINPDNKPDQNPLADTKVVDFKSLQGSAFAIMDLTPAYDKTSSSVKRGIALSEKHQSVIIEDEIENKQPADVYWFAHTRADIQLNKNGKTATLTQNGKKYFATVVSPSNARFVIQQAVPLGTSPKPQENNPNNGIQKLTVYIPQANQARIVVAFHPQKNPVKTVYEKPLNSWK
ncbi:MAG: heparinase II/III domain-containing protein [Ginsengibacter sp.]